jgi:serine/threonine protein kinase
MFVPDTIVRNRYHIFREIARGGMGIIYLARDRQFDDEVALKVSIWTDEKFRHAFEREAKLLAKLRHQGLPQVRGYFEEDNKQCLVMEFIGGENLLKGLENRHNRGLRGLDLEELMNISRQLCEIVGYLHSQGVIHRDIKPENIKQMENGQIVLLDFGLAKNSTTSLHASSMAYASPEQASNTGTDERSDIFSIGATLYHLSTGEIPAASPYRLSRLLSDKTDPLKPAHSVKGDIPFHFSNALTWALQLSAKDRPSTIHYFEQAIKGSLSVPISQSSENEIISAHLPNKSSILEKNEITSPEQYLSAPNLILPENQNLGLSNPHLTFVGKKTPIQNVPSHSGDNFTTGNLSTPHQVTQPNPTNLVLPANQNQFVIPDPAANPQKNKHLIRNLLIGIGSFLLLTLILAGGVTAWRFNLFPLSQKTAPTKTIEVKMISIREKDVPVAPEFNFRSGDKMRFGIVSPEVGFIHIVSLNHTGKLARLFPPGSITPETAKIIPGQENNTTAMQFGEEDIGDKQFVADNVYFIFSTDFDDPLLKETRDLLENADVRGLSVSEPNVKALLEKLEKLVQKADYRSSEIKFNLNDKTIVGMSEIRSAGR